MNKLKNIFNKQPVFKYLSTKLLSPEKYRGSLTSFVRGSTAVFTDFDGLIRTAKSGEVRFEGARRVENLLTFTEDFSNTSWIKTPSGTGSTAVVTANAFTAPDGTLTADQVVLNLNGGNTTADISQIYQSYTDVIGLKKVASIWVNVPIGKTIRISVGAGVGVLNYAGTGSWSRLSILYTATVSTTVSYSIQLRGGFGVSDTATIYLWGALLENITSQTNQNPSEYVSNGVPVGLIGSELVTNGTFDASANWTLTATGGATATITAGQLKLNRNNGGIPTASQTLSGLIVGNKYSATIAIAYGSTWSYTLLVNGVDLTGLATATEGVYAYNFTATITNPVVQIESRSSLVSVLNIDTISIKETVFYGANVDGVKYFETYNGNTVSSNVVTESVGAKIPNPQGSLFEQSRTQHFKTSNAPATQTSPTLATGVYTLSVVEGIGSISVAGTTATITGAGTATLNNPVTFTVTVAGTVTYTKSGTVTKSQSELGEFASSYIENTETGLVVRNADTPIFIKTIGNLDTAKGTIYFEFTPQFNAVAGFIGYLQGSYIDSNNFVGVRINGAAIEFVNKVAGTEYVAFVPLSFVASTTYKGAVSFGGGLRIAVAGVVGTKNTNAQSLKFGSTFQWGADGNSLNQPFSCIKNEMIYSYAMSEQELARLTS